MNNDTTLFRTQIVEPAAATSEPENIQDDSPKTTVTSADVPYTAYESEHAKPFVADYFELGDLWNDANGGFSKEVSIIEEYFTKKVNRGEIENKTDVIKEKLKEIEKLANTHGDGRKNIRLGTISAYLEYLMKVDKVMYNARRYSKIN